MVNTRKSNARQIELPGEFANIIEQTEKTQNENTCNMVQKRFDAFFDEFAHQYGTDEAQKAAAEIIAEFEVICKHYGIKQMAVAAMCGEKGMSEGRFSLIKKGISTSKKGGHKWHIFRVATAYKKAIIKHLSI